MLTITRKSGQSVVVQVPGHAPLTISVLGSRPGKCQLTFDGPHDYHILREELVVRDALRSDAFCLPSANASCISPQEDKSRIPASPR